MIPPADHDSGRTKARELLRSWISSDAHALQQRAGNTAESVWRLALDEARASLRPYLAYRLEQQRLIHLVPPAAREALAVARRGGTILELQRRMAVRGIVSALSSRDIPVIGLKGVALGHLVYPEPSLRPMRDVDFWVPLEQLEAAAQALMPAGYRYPVSKYLGQSELGVPERALELPGTPINVEFQGSPSSLVGLGQEFRRRAWARAQTVSLGTFVIKALHPEDLLIHVCLHALGHHRLCAGPLPLLDVRLTVERWLPEWDWPAMARDYVNLGIAARMCLMLDLARDLLGAPVPDAFFAALPAPAQLDELKSLAIEQLWAVDHHLPRALERGLGGTTLGGRARWLWHRFTTHYAQDLPATSRGPLAAAREVGRRVLHDFSVKVPRYLRGWIRGDLRGAELQRRAALARGRERLAELLAEAESQTTLQ